MPNLRRDRPLDQQIIFDVLGPAKSMMEYEDWCSEALCQNLEI